MIDKDDAEGQNYGYFFLDDIVYLHSGYQREKFSSKYDISIAKIIAGKGVEFPPDCLHFSNHFPGLVYPGGFAPAPSFPHNIGLHFGQPVHNV